VKTQFATLNREFTALRPSWRSCTSRHADCGRGGGGGGGRGSGGRRFGEHRQQGRNAEDPGAEYLGNSERSAGSQYADLKLAVPKTIAEANMFLAKVPSVSAALKKYDLTLTVPPVEK